jgi:ATP synthase protein I
MAVFPWVLQKTGGRIDMAASDPDEAPGGGEDPRLASLEDRLKAAHHLEAERTAPKGANAAFTGKGASQGNRVLSTLIGAPLGAMLIGWLLDRWLDTRPKAMLIMLFLGIISAFVQIWRISKERAE